MKTDKDFYQLEKRILELRQQLTEIEEGPEASKKQKITQIKKEIRREWEAIKPSFTAFNIVQIARHPQRPYTLDYINYLTEDFMELHGDRQAGDDPAAVAGFGFYRGQSLAFIGHQKGRTTRERIERNFGQPNPEGFRKALRVMKLAEKFELPVVTFIDTPGAYPGIRAEERGQAEAIAHNLKMISMLNTPIVNIVIGEGGSGGALAIGVGDVIMMLEYSFYSVISPEGCAAILWKDQSAVAQAAENLKIRAQDLLDLGIIDKIIPEPPGGAHIDPIQTFKNVDKQLSLTLKRLKLKTPEERLEARYQKFRKIGVFTEK
ncbi:MAG: acetyl-CoA carboxylase carboxyltransferase subunit alpha [Candidatus Aminicenantales bacterium]